jgi:TatD DNase family protein
MALTDTHCHLDVEQFDEDREQVIQRAVESGVARMLIPGIDLESSRSAIEIAEKFPEVYAAVGVHPNNGLSWNGETLTHLRELAKLPKVVAIGEIGLDYYRDLTPRYVQEQIFHHQLELAAEVGLPVIVHSREATKDILRILTNWHERLVERELELAKRPGVLHSYSGNIVEAEQAKRIGFFLGFTGPVTFKNASELQNVVARIDLDRILVETDSPYLTPHPYRGKRNEPIRVQLVSEKIAELHKLPSDRIIQKTYENAERLFAW